MQLSFRLRLTTTIFIGDINTAVYNNVHMLLCWRFPHYLFLYNNKSIAFFTVLLTSVYQVGRNYEPYTTQTPYLLLSVGDFDVTFSWTFPVIE